MIKVKVIITQDQYAALIEQLELDIEDSDDIENIKELMSVLKTLEEDCEDIEATDDK